LIFERFTQADTNITRKYGGTGLGLPITKQLIELQHGNISFRNDPDSGVEFSFLLPYKKLQGAQVVHASSAPAADIIIAPGKKVLLVEDNLMNQKLATIVLQNNGLDVTLASNGEKAIELLKKNSFDIILMDIQMPGMDGYKTTEILRDQLHIATPVIAMTAHALAGEKEKCLQAGMNDYISKPFTEKGLLVKIAQHIHDKEAVLDKTNLVDLDYLKKQTANNTLFMREMIDIFKTQNPGVITQLEKAIEANDFTGIYKAVHSLRNTIGLFGLGNILNEPLMNMEKLSSGRTGIQQLQSDFETVRSVCAGAIKELEMLDAK